MKCLKINENPMKICDLMMKINDFGMIFDKKHDFDKKYENQKFQNFYGSFVSHFLSF